MAKFVQTAVVSKEDGGLVKFCKTAEELQEFDGREDVSLVTRKSFEASEKYPSFDELVGKVKPVAAPAASESKRAAAPALSGPYHLLKPLPAVAEDHPKKPIWDAIVANNGGTAEAAKAACPEKNPPRRTSGFYTFSSEFRYFLKTGYVAMGEIPEGFDYTQVGKKEAAPAAAA